MPLKTEQCGGMEFTVPYYFEQVETNPDDAPGSVALAAQSEHAICFAVASPIAPEQCIPFKREDTLAGTRQYLNENQGIIEVDGDGTRVYTIVKTHMEDHLQYLLTFQKFFDRDRILFVQLWCEETGVTGERESIIMSQYLKTFSEKIDTDEENIPPWCKDPYDPTVTTGMLMNIAEWEEFDPSFPGHPLTMCRQFLRALLGDGEEK